MHIAEQLRIMVLDDYDLSMESTFFERGCRSGRRIEAILDIDADYFKDVAKHSTPERRQAARHELHECTKAGPRDE